MSQFPPSQPIPPSQPGPLPRPPGGNGLGIAGFVTSLVGLLLLCTGWGWLLSIVGTILSAVAMRKRPRGLAIAGLVIGLVGCVWILIALVVLGGVMAIGLGGLAAVGVAQQRVEQHNAALVVAAAQAYQKDKGAAPPDVDALLKGQYLTTTPLDALGHELYLKAGPDGKIGVWSPGADKVNGTSDDREVEPSEVGGR